MCSQNPSDGLIGLRVANLTLWLDSRGAGIPMSLPACHARFLADGGGPNGGLVLRVRDGLLPGTEGWRPLYDQSETWELWVDDLGRYVFVAPQVSPPRRYVTVDAGFAAGEVMGEFARGANGTPASYPLQDIDIVLFANWLAGYGDVILHAAGVVVDDRGYCFVGSAGAGKSTLVASLSAPSWEASEAYTRNGSSLHVLGEDNLVLRWMEGRFWIHGTPWHLNPAYCSPHGAPLEKLFFLDRTAPAGVRSCTPSEGVSRLLQTAFIPYYRPDAVSVILDRLVLLAEQVRFYTLSFRLGANVLELIRDI